MNSDFGYSSLRENQGKKGDVNDIHSSKTTRSGTGWKSADDICDSYPDGSRRYRSNDVDREDIERRNACRKDFKTRPISSPTSSTVNSSSTLLGSSNPSSVTESKHESFPDVSQQDSSTRLHDDLSVHGKEDKIFIRKNMSSPTHLTVANSRENGMEFLSGPATHFSSPKSVSQAALCSNESSDAERGFMLDANRAFDSRDLNFQRSVSFQERILDSGNTDVDSVRCLNENRLSESFPSNSAANSASSSFISNTTSSLNSSKEKEKDKSPHFSHNHHPPSDSVSSLSYSPSQKEREKHPTHSHATDATSVTSQTSSGKDKDRDKKEGKTSDKEKEKKNRKAWYNVLSRTYKHRSEELKRLFKELPSDERLIVDYSCALQKEILVHGRLYVTSNYFCFYSKIFGWETCLTLKCKDIIAMTKERTAKVIPNAIQITTDSEKHFFCSFGTRDKTFLMMFRIWQNALMDQQISTAELWNWVHSSYGEELGLTSDDDDYVAPSLEDTCRGSNYGPVGFEIPPDAAPQENLLRVAKRCSVESVEEQDCCSQGDTHLDDAVVVSPKRPASFEASETSADSPHVGLTGKGDSSLYASHNASPVKNEDDELPTDISDSLGSDLEDKITGSPYDTVICPNIRTHHVGREVCNAVYPIAIDTLFALLFTDSKFILDFHTARKTCDIVSSPWQSNAETNQRIRQVTYTLTLPTSSFGPKVSHVTETQVISDFSNSSEIYTVDAEASNSGIPYADSFCISNHWCLTREDKNETRLTVWSQVKYKKNVWGFMKSVIDKNACSGIDSFMNDLNDSLLLEVDKSSLKKTKRRRRRGGSKVLNDLNEVLPLGSNGDLHKSTQFPLRKMTIPSIPTDTSQLVSTPYWGSAAFFPLCFLLLVNSVLYYRLYALEQRMVGAFAPYGSMELEASILQFASSSEGADSLTDDWLRILHHQEALHSEEVKKWAQAVSEAADHLKRAEESLRVLHSAIPNSQSSKLQTLLKELQLLRQKKLFKASQEPIRPNQEPSSGFRDKGSRPNEGKDEGEL